MAVTPSQNLLWDNLIQSPSKFIFMKMTIPPIILPQKLLLKPWYMNVYLMVEWMVEWTHLILMMSFQLSRPRLETHLKIHKKSIPIKDMFLLELNKFMDHLVDRGANGGLAGADMRVLQKTDRKIDIVFIDDHELTGLAVVTAATPFDTQKGPVMGFSMKMLMLERGDLFMVLDKWNGLTARWMRDPKLLEVPKELKPLMDMCSHSPLSLVWFVCTPSRFQLMMTFSNILMFSSHHLAFGMLLLWIMVLHLHFLMKSSNKLMIHCSRTIFLMK